MVKQLIKDEAGDVGIRPTASARGALDLPYSVGMNGRVFHASLVV